MATQLQIAQNETVSEEVKQVSEVENTNAELIRKEIAAGRLVIPANKLHLKTNLKPSGIGRLLTTKVNANIGASSIRSTVEDELEKMRVALEAGADAIMDLSTGGNLDKTREKLLAECPVPFGTVPIYQVIEKRHVEDINEKIILSCFRLFALNIIDEIMIIFDRIEFI